MRRKAAVTAGSIAVAGALAWAVPNLAHAEDSAAEPSPGATTSDSADPKRETMRAELAERLAEELGLDADEVNEALTTVGAEMRAEHHAERLATMEERLAGAVESGRITQERADEILKAAEDGNLPGRMGRRNGGHRGFAPGGAGVPEEGIAPDAGTGSETSYTLVVAPGS